MNRILAALVAIHVSLMAGCGSLPSLEGRNQSFALRGTQATPLGRSIAPQAAAQPGRTGIYALIEATDAFAARVVLASLAEMSLDAQYYIWHGDQTGYLLLEALWRAAERGVRVRLLLDDINTGGLDETIAALDAHPNIEVRLYNPVLQRGARGLNFLTDFSRVNRRMHNKSFTADNQAAIVGGRNVGNEYYGAGRGVGFEDLDVIAIGAAVGAVSQEFDLYWNSASAYPAATILGTAGPGAAEALQAKFAEVRADPESTAYLKAVRETPLLQELTAGKLPFEWTSARVLHDDPAKTLDEEGRTDLLLLSRLMQAADPPRKSFHLISPYFVPGEDGAEALAALARSGVAVRVLTNSLAATDIGAVHAGYAKRRHTLLRAGVRLYELKPTALEEKPEDKKRTGSSSASLHAKTFALDGSRIFVGSFNFDQRSAKLNTEMGLLIESPVLAGRLAAAFENEVPKVAYEVRLVPNTGELEWIEQTRTGEKRYGTEPGAGLLRRFGVGLMSILPIEWLL